MTFNSTKILNFPKIYYPELKNLQFCFANFLLNVVADWFSLCPGYCHRTDNPLWRWLSLNGWVITISYVGPLMWFGDMVQWWGQLVTRYPGKQPLKFRWFWWHVLPVPEISIVCTMEFSCSGNRIHISFSPKFNQTDRLMQQFLLKKK